MKNRKILPSELILNNDGSVFHLHLLPSQIAKTIILVGDPGRVDTVASFFDTIECRVSNREFMTITGQYKGKAISVVSTGIGTDNIDIVLNELDALVNIDLATREVKDELTSLTILRIGTSGAIQSDLKLGDFVFSHYSIGFDNTLMFYHGQEDVRYSALERLFVNQTSWQWASPYIVKASEQIWDAFKDITREGFTISAPGFYAPQGRHLRIAPLRSDLNQRLEEFMFNGISITNYEMESSALAGLSALMGHRAGTVCAVIAQRVQGDVDVEYKDFVKELIKASLDRIITL